MEEAQTQQGERVKVKEDARKVAEAERDRVVVQAQKCTGGPSMVAAAEKVVEAARAVTVLEREVAQCAAPVMIEEWQVAGGQKRKTVQVGSHLGRPLDVDRRKSLQRVVSKVQGLVVVANLGWGVVLSLYTAHGGDEVLWTVRGVEMDKNGSAVAGMLL